MTALTQYSVKPDPNLRGDAYAYRNGDTIRVSPQLWRRLCDVPYERHAEIWARVEVLTVREEACVGMAH